MIAISCLRLILFILFVGITTGYLITSETTEDEFPVQWANPKNSSTFFRMNKDGKREKLVCPWGYKFDKNENHCVKNSDEPEPVSGICLRLGLAEGDHSNPDSCGTFYSCNAECCDLITCPAKLLFSVSNDQCDYPDLAQCCEYSEKNPNRLVQ